MVDYRRLLLKFRKSSDDWLLEQRIEEKIGSERLMIKTLKSVKIILFRFQGRNNETHSSRQPL